MQQRALTKRCRFIAADTLQTLISLSKSKNEEDQRLLQAVYGIVFFGVPHDGMDIMSLIPMVGDGPNRFLVESLSRINSQILSIQQREFESALGGQGDSEVVCFYETEESPTAQQVCINESPGYVYKLIGIGQCWRLGHGRPSCHISHQSVCNPWAVLGKWSRAFLCCGSDTFEYGQV